MTAPPPGRVFPADLDPDRFAIAALAVPACPECQVRKCGNCDGTSWDPAAGCPAPCPCTHP